MFNINLTEIYSPRDISSIGQHCIRFTWTGVPAAKVVKIKCPVSKQFPNICAVLEEVCLFGY